MRCGTHTRLVVIALTNLSIIPLSVFMSKTHASIYVYTISIWYFIRCLSSLPSQNLLILDEFHKLSGHLWTKELPEMVWNVPSMLPVYALHRWKTEAMVSTPFLLLFLRFFKIIRMLKETWINMYKALLFRHI